jgi:hypothetical protein
MAEKTAAYIFTGQDGKFSYVNDKGERVYPKNGDKVQLNERRAKAFPEYFESVASIEAKAKVAAELAKKEEPKKDDPKTEPPKA